MKAPGGASQSSRRPGVLPNLTRNLASTVTVTAAGGRGSPPLARRTRADLQERAQAGGLVAHWQNPTCLDIMMGHSMMAVALRWWTLVP